MSKIDKKIITMRVSEGLYNDIQDILSQRPEFEDLSSYIRYCIRQENNSFYNQSILLKKKNSQ